MEFKYALNIAHSLLGKLTPDITKMHIAGSVRREKPEVKDIEIVCLPKMDINFSSNSGGLFGPEVPGYKVIEKKVVTKSFMNTVLALGIPLKGNPGGRYMQILLPDGINLDLFMPEAHDYYRQLAIRTGPAEYSYAVLAVGWRKLGWCGTSEGLRLMSQCQERKQCSGKSIWNCIVPEPELPPHWQSEQEFYNWLKVPYLEPTQR